MAAVLRLVQRSNDELVRILEGALAEARAGKLHSMAGCFLGDDGHEFMVLCGTYRANRIAALRAGMKLKAHGSN